MSKREEIEYKLLKIEYFSCIFLILFFTIGFILLRIYINLITPSSAIEFLFSQNSSKRLYMSILLLVVVMIPSYIFFNALLFVKYFGLKLTKTFLSSLISFIIATLLIFIFVERLGIGFVLSYFLIVPIIHYIDLKTKKEFLPKNVYKIYTTYYGSPFKRILFRRLVPEIGESSPFLKKEKRKLEAITIAFFVFYPLRAYPHSLFLLTNLFINL